MSFRTYYKVVPKDLLFIFLMSTCSIIEVWVLYNYLCIQYCAYLCISKTNNIEAKLQNLWIHKNHGRMTIEFLRKKICWRIGREIFYKKIHLKNSYYILRKILLLP